MPFKSLPSCRNRPHRLPRVRPRSLTQERSDVLPPVHEQAFLFAKVRDQLPTGVGVPLAAFDAFMQVQGKVAFARLMERLSLPQPVTHIVRSRAELEVIEKFPESKS